MTATATARADSRRDRAEEAARLRARRRRNRRIVVTAIAAVVAVIAVLVVVGATNGSGKGSTKGAARGAVPAAVFTALTGVPAATLDGVGIGSASGGGVRAVSGAPLVAGGHPVVLYVGAEYCPFCAAERWPLIQALSRFGTFSGLRTTRSAAHDVHPNTATFTFVGSTYTSKYLTFQSRELYGNTLSGGRYDPLQKLDRQQAATFSQYGSSGFPFLDIGGRYIVPGASYDPSVLAGLTWTDIAGSLANASSPVARGVDGSANLLTALLCRSTGGAPAAVCTAPGVTAAASRIHG